MLVSPDRPWRPLGLCLGLALLVYGRILSHPFLFDDRALIEQDPRVTGEASLVAGEGGWMRVLDRASLRVDRFFWEGNPVGFRLTNLFLHALCGFAVFLLARKLGAGRVAAYGGAVLFLLHPLLSENVCLAANRKGMLGLLPGAAAVLLAVRGGGWGWGGAFLLTGLAVLAYEAVALLPLVLPFWMGGGSPRERRLRGFLRAGAILAVVALPFVGARHPWRPSEGVHHRAFEGAPPSAVRAAAVRAQVYQAIRFLVPRDPRIDYAFSVPTADPFRTAWPSLLFLVVVWGGACAVARKAGGGGGIAWAGFLSIPTSNLVFPASYLVADRYWYLPAAGICTVAATWIARLDGPSRRRVAVPLGGILLAFGIGSFHRAGEWRGEEHLYGEGIRSHPRSADALNGYGAARGNRNPPDPRRAWRSLRHAVLADPDHAETLVNLGWLHFLQGDAAEAERLCLKAVRRQPTFVQAHRMLFRIRMARGRWGLAGEGLRFLEVVPGIPPVDVASARRELDAVLAGELAAAKDPADRARLQAYRLQALPLPPDEVQVAIDEVLAHGLDEDLLRARFALPYHAPLRNDDGGRWDLFSLDLFRLLVRFDRLVAGDLLELELSYLDRLRNEGGAWWVDSIERMANASERPEAGSDRFASRSEYLFLVPLPWDVFASHVARIVAEGDPDRGDPLASAILLQLCRVHGDTVRVDTLRDWAVWQTLRLARWRGWTEADVRRREEALLSVPLPPGTDRDWFESFVRDVNQEVLRRISDRR